MEADDLSGRIGQRSFCLFSRRKISEKALAAKVEDILESMQRLPAIKASKLNVTAAIAAVTSSEQSFHQLLLRLDAALKRAKALGTARCIFAENAPGPREGQRRAVSGIQSLQPMLLDMVFHLLFNAQDIDAGIRASIALIGRIVDVSRIFVFEQRGSNTLACKFEWCAENIPPQEEQLQNEPCGSVAARDFRAYFSRDGLLVLRCPEETGGKLKEAAQREGIVSLLEGALTENGRAVGYIGYEERRAGRQIMQDQIDLITSISRVLNVFLLKRRASLQQEQETAYLDALYSCVDQSAFSIDSGSREIRVCNRRTREKIGRDATGECCYSAFWDRNEPCENCPADALDNGKALPPMQQPCGCVLVYGLPYEGKRVISPRLAED